MACPNPIPVFVPSACGINQTQVFNDRTTRAARKAIKNGSIYAGQAQSSRISTLKNCIAQVNDSERAFNQVVRRTIRVRDIITFQTTETQFIPTEQAAAYSNTYRNAAQPRVQVISFDPAGNLYSLLDTSAGIFIAKFANGDISGEPTTGPLFASNQGSLINANLFWKDNTLVFVGVFYKTSSVIQVYTINSSLAATIRLSIPIAGTKQYTGQAAYNSAGYIYVILCPPLQFGFELAPIYYISPTWTYITTNMLASFASIQQTAGDTLGGAAVGAYSQSGIVLTYLSGATVSWKKTIGLPTASSTPCALVILNSTAVLANPVGDYIFVLFFDGAKFQTQLISYTKVSPTVITTNTNVNIAWPFDTPYIVRSISLSYKVGQNAETPRFFYTMYLYNPTVVNFEYYIQNGEIDATGAILSYTNIQIGPSYNVSPSNTIQSNASLTAVSSGEELILYATSYSRPFTAIITRQAPRDFCQTIIVYPGCDCPTVPVNSILPSVSGLTRTLQIAVCDPQIFTNTTAVDDCAPVYTPPTKFLTPAQGAEPPQGPAVSTVVRKYTTISGIDQICKPIPGRFSSSWTARLRSSIQSATDTRYVNTVLPVVTYPFPCPVYGNQAGNPVASLCRPMIDGRPTTNI